MGSGQEHGSDSEDRRRRNLKAGGGDKATKQQVKEGQVGRRRSGEKISEKGDDGICASGKFSISPKTAYQEWGRRTKKVEEKTKTPGVGRGMELLRLVCFQESWETGIGWIRLGEGGGRKTGEERRGGGGGEEGAGRKRSEGRIGHEWTGRTGLRIHVGSGIGYDS